MQHTITRGRRRFGAAVVTAALVAGVLALGAPSASATADVKQARVGGVDRFDTAAKVAKAGFPTGAPTVIVASGRKFPDALAGSSLGVPILLTEPTSLPSATSKALTDLKATKALILGGTAAVSEAVRSKIQDQGVSTTRIAGLDRYETAGAIAGTFTQTDVAKLNAKSTAIIATGQDFADALAGGPLASSPNTGAYPVLLVNDTVPPATKKAIADLAIKQVVILGGTAAVTTAVQTELETETGSQAIRLAGTNRYGTATKIADAAIKDFGMAGKEALLANAFSFADALSGGALGALRGAPILLTDQIRLNDEPKAWLVSHSSTVANVTALGGSAAVSDSTLSAAEKAAETPPAVRLNEKYKVSPSSTTHAAGNGTISYTAQVGTDTVDIVLLPCEYVQTTSAGDTVFTNVNTNAVADGSAKSGSAPDLADTDAVISAVNGTPTDTSGVTTNPNYADAKKGDAAGTLTFDVDGPGSSSVECVVPVVFNDADLGNAMNSSTANPATPSELFGTGGQALFTPAEAASGQFTVDTRLNDESLDSFVGCTLVNDGNTANGGPEAPPTGACGTTNATYFYDANDTFLYNAGTTTTKVDLAAFETYLTTGDDVKGTYAPEPSGVSIFNLYSDEAPEPPSRTQTAPKQAQGVTFEITQSSRSTVDHYRLYRLEKTSSITECPKSIDSYIKVDEIEDKDPGRDNPSLTLTLTDQSPVAGTTYCYTITSVEAGDVGPGTTPEIVTTGAGPSGAPRIIGAKGASADPLLNAGDVHELAFDAPLATGSDTSGTYTVTGSPSSPDTVISCADAASAVCSLSADGKVLRVRILSNPLIAYPLTIKSTTLKGANGTTPVDLPNSSDTAIESTSLQGDTTAPTISSATISTGGADNNWGAPGDVLDLAYTDASSIVLRDADGSLTAAQVTAITGKTVTYNTDGTTVVKGLVLPDGKTLRLTVDAAHSGLQSGIGNAAHSDKTPGTNTNVVTDAAGNPEAPAANGGPAALPPS